MMFAGGLVLSRRISTMPASCRIASLIPNGLIVESETSGDDEICLVVRAEARVVVCPLCASPSRRIHSRYVRRVSDLPCSGRLVRLHIVTRRFCCEASDCPRRIFAERFWRGGAAGPLAQDGSTRGARASSRSGARRPAGSVLRQAADAARQQRHAAARREAASVIQGRCLERDRYR